MRFADETPSLTPDERRAEIASILAAGILRLRARAALPGDETAGNGEDLGENVSSCLEVSSETVLSVQHG